MAHGQGQTPCNAQESLKAKTRLIPWKLDSSGQYCRQIGWKPGQTGQTKFRLGNDLEKAKLAAQRLGMLWDVIVADHGKSVRFEQDDFSSAATTTATRPTWIPEALTIAEAVRKHHHFIKVAQPDSIVGPSAYASYLDHLNQIYGHVIAILPLDEQTALEGRQNHQHVAEQRLRQARVNSRIAQVPLTPMTAGATLYQALDAYAEHAALTNTKEHGKVEAAHALRLKDSTPDMDLSEFGYTALEKLKNYWAARPEAKFVVARAKESPSPWARSPVTSKRLGGL